MNINSGTVTIVVALAAIISPIFVAIINNVHHAKMEALSYSHQEKMRELDLQDKRESENLKYLHSIYENYLKSASRCIAVQNAENIKLYGECYSISFIYFPPASYERLESINASIRNRDWEDANTQLEEFSIWLAPLMKEMLKV